MAKTFTAPFAQTQRNGWVVVTTPTGMSGGSDYLLLTSGPEGALVTSISVLPLGDLNAETTVGGSPLIYLKRQGSEAQFLVARVNFAKSYALSPTNPIPKLSFDIALEGAPIRLGPGDEIYAGYVGVTTGTIPHGIAFFAQYTDY